MSQPIPGDDRKVTTEDTSAALSPELIAPEAGPLVRRETQSLPARKHAEVPASLSAAPDPLGMFRAFQRRIHLALGLGSLLAIIIGPLAFFLVPQAKFTARALVLVPSQSPRILESVMESQSLAGEEYKRFQKTQIAQLMSSTVLNVAVKNLAEATEANTNASRNLPKLADFHILKGEPDIVEFLQRTVQVSFKDGSELMEIALSGEKAEELAALVDAIKEAYMDEIALKEHNKKALRQHQLVTIKNEKERELRERRAKAKGLAESVGSDDRETLVIKQKLQIEQISDLERQLAECRALRRRIEAEIEVRSRHPGMSPRSAAAAAPAGVDLESVIDRMPAVVQLNQELVASQSKLQQSLAHNKGVLRNPENDPVIKGLRKHVEQLEGELAQTREDLRPVAAKQLARVNQTEPGSDLEQLQFKLEATIVLEEELQKDREQVKLDSQKLNVDTIDLTTVQEEIAQSKLKFQELTSEVEKLGIEIQAPTRVQVVEDAKVPKYKDEKKRYIMIAAATFGAFFGGLALVTLIEFKHRKLTTAEDVVHGLGIQLVGSLPPIPSKSRRRSRLENSEDADWYRVMLESIDSTRTMLVHEAKAGKLNVMMVTSAMGGEGKTSLSCHLATSLARAGFRTVLLDADLRNPSVDQVFDIATGPGLSDLLRGEPDVAPFLIPSVHPDLTLLPAGECDEAAIRGLSRGRLKSIFAQLREQFDFVVVDSAPVLPVADTLAIAPHVDAVILSTLRDVSRLPKVFAAYQRIGLLGVRILGAVVTGVYGGLYGNDYRYPYPYPGRTRQRSSTMTDQATDSMRNAPTSDSGEQA